MILVISHDGDPHALAVLAELRRRGHSCEMMDSGAFPRSASLSLRYDPKTQSGEFLTDERRIDLQAVRVAWWRRPRPYTLEPGLEEAVASFSYAECHEALAGAWACLDATWVNPPAQDEVAHHKPYQLKIARDVGLAIPQTLITNDPNAARRFLAERGGQRTIYKTFLASEQCWRETRVVRRDEIAMLDLVKIAPVIFQAYVPATADIRLTVMGRHMFAAAITAAPGGYDIDYRMDMEGAQFRPIQIPDALRTKVGSLMTRLGLVYGAIDLRQTSAGEFVFLEINPAGEWQFVEERTEQSMTKTFAELLVELAG